MTRSFVLLTTFLSVISAWPSGPASAEIPADGAAHFVREGRLFRAASVSGGRDRGISVEPVSVAERVHEFLGDLPGNRLLVSLGEPFLLGSLIHERGVDIAVLGPDGTILSVAARNAVRAYPSPDGAKIAVIDIDYSLRIHEGAKRRPVPIPGRTVLAAWSPDATKLCASAYPADWSPHRLANPDSPEEMLRLLDSDLYLFDVATGGVERLTDHPAPDYGAVFSPDGARILFMSARYGHHAFHGLDLATRRIAQLTNLDGYDIPIARSDTIAWIEAGGRIVYESQEDALRNGIRSLRADGTEPRLLGTGRRPRPSPDGRRVLYLDDDGLVRSAEIEK